MFFTDDSSTSTLEQSFDSGDVLGLNTTATRHTSLFCETEDEEEWLGRRRERESERKKKRILDTTITNNYEMSICWENEGGREREKGNLSTHADQYHSTVVIARVVALSSRSLFLLLYGPLRVIEQNWIGNHWLYAIWTTNYIDF